MTALGASDSLSPPTVTHPCESPVPGDDECTTANPRGTQSLTSVLAMIGRMPERTISGGLLRLSGSAPSSWRTSHISDCADPAVPA